MFRSPADLEAHRRRLLAETPAEARRIVISSGTCGRAYGAIPLAGSFHRELEKRGLAESTAVRITGCLGFCEQEPLVILEPSGVCYPRPKLEDVPAIVEKTLLGGEAIESLLYRDPSTRERIGHLEEIPFYKQQNPILFGANRLMDPTSLDDYIRQGGYSALAKALTSMKPGEIIEAVKSSGLRGRGGAGFPAGRKWESCRKAPGDLKYGRCNADEGDPGAYANRGLLEGNPHSVLEGMILGAYAIGAREGYIYVRSEYPLAVEYLRKAIHDAMDAGLLGDNILGADFSLRVFISIGAGAFVCGESTALMTSIAGKPGEPRPKHIHTTTSGLWDRPSCLNNVETWANIPLIVNRGAEWFRSIGTEKSPGTKIFSLVGKIRNTGLVEVPLGITLREIVFGIGGGVPKGREFKAIQTGGPSGGCIPADLLDLPVDYDRLTECGAMMGSGGMIVMDDTVCMVDVARYFTKFLMEESCGKCLPCREGVLQLYHLLDDICEGRGTPAHLDTLEELSLMIQDSSLCQLGKTAPNPTLTTLKYFREEYLEHIEMGFCRAGVCKSLYRLEIDPEKCNGCGQCLKKCPSQAITGEKKSPHRIHNELCVQCGVCGQVCKFEAIQVRPPRPAAVGEAG